MEQVKRLVDIYITSERQEEVDKLVEGIQNGETTLLQLIKALGDYLTSEDEAIRTKGLTLLAVILPLCAPNTLNQNAVRVLTAFFCDKIDDVSTLLPTLKGITSLCESESFNATLAKEVAEKLFTIDMRSQAQNVRFLVFKLVDTLLSLQRKALLDLGEHFVTGWLKLSSNEKDPRNLHLAFAIYRVVLIEFPIDSHSQDLFDNVFCYLPITYRPPPEDLSGISADDLIQDLRSVITATPLFGPRAVPLFIEKLMLASPVVRRDILQTVAVALPSYGYHVAFENAEELWKCLRIEIFQPTNKLTETDALAALGSLLTTLNSGDMPFMLEDTRGLYKSISEECAGLLEEPARNQANPAIKVTACLLRVGGAVAQSTFERIVVPLLGRFFQPDLASTVRPAIMRCLSIVFSSGLETWSPTMDDNPLLKRKDELLAAFTVGLKTPSCQEASLSAISSVISTTGLLGEDDLEYVVQGINEVIFGAEDPSNTTREMGIEVLCKIAASTPIVLERFTLPLLFSSLPDEPPVTDEEIASSWRILSGLEQLCVAAPLFQTLTIRLLAKVDVLCGLRCQNSTYGVQSEFKDWKPRAAYCHSLLFSLSQILAKKVEQKHPDVTKYVTELVERLYRLFIVSASQSPSGSAVATQPRIIDVGKRLASLIMQSLSEQQQATLLKTLYDAFLIGDVGALFPSGKVAQTNIQFSPFKSNSIAQKNCVPLFTATLICTLPKVPLPVDSFDQFVIEMLHWSLEMADDEAQSCAVHQAIGSLLNKHPQSFSPVLSQHFEQLFINHILNSQLPQQRRNRALSAWRWICHGLVVGGHSRAFELVDRIFPLFDDQEIAWKAGSTIGLIGGKSDVFIKQNHAVVKLLHTQKYVRHVLPLIVDGTSDSKSSRMVPSLVALTSLIKHLPKTHYEAELATLLPLLIRSLDLGNDDVSADVIDTISDVSLDGSASALTAEYAPTIAAAVLKIAIRQDGGHSGLRARTAALRLLGSLPDVVRYDILHPHKAIFIRTLGSLLDDPKRSIRMEAVEARTAWITYSGDT